MTPTAPVLAGAPTPGVVVPAALSARGSALRAADTNTSA